MRYRISHLRRRLWRRRLKRLRLADEWDNIPLCVRMYVRCRFEDECWCWLPELYLRKIYVLVPGHLSGR